MKFNLFFLFILLSIIPLHAQQSFDYESFSKNLLIRSKHVSSTIEFDNTDGICANLSLYFYTENNKIAIIMPTSIDHKVAMFKIETLNDSSTFIQFSSDTCRLSIEIANMNIHNGSYNSLFHSEELNKLLRDLVDKFASDNATKNNESNQSRLPFELPKIDLKLQKNLGIIQINTVFDEPTDNDDNFKSGFLIINKNGIRLDALNVTDIEYIEKMKIENDVVFSIKKRRTKFIIIPSKYTLSNSIWTKSNNK